MEKRMKIALTGSDWEPSELSFLEKKGELVSPWSAGRDTTVAVSKLPSGTRYYAWYRGFTQRDPEWVFWVDTLKKLVKRIEQEVKDETTT